METIPVVADEISFFLRAMMIKNTEMHFGWKIETHLQISTLKYTNSLVSENNISNNFLGYFLI